MNIPKKMSLVHHNRYIKVTPTVWLSLVMSDIMTHFPSRKKKICIWCILDIITEKQTEERRTHFPLCTITHTSASELLAAKESTFWKKDCAATTQLLVCEWRLQLSWLLMLESLSTVMFVGQAHLSSFQYYKSVYEEKKEEARSS